MNAHSPTLYRSSGRPGYSQAVAEHPRRVRARKLVNEVQVAFSPTPCTVKTREGVVQVHTGDAIVTGISGDRWRVSRAHFARKYAPVAPTVAGQDGRYRSLPNNILAVQMPEAFDVTLADGLSRLSGQANDWLVDYGDGSLGIVGGAIFASTYEIVD